MSDLFERYCFRKQIPLCSNSILVIEDNAMDRVFIQKVLEKRYTKIFIAENGQQGISLALLEKIDVIILDYLLPDQDGLEICRFFKENKRTHKIPIIFLTVLQDGHRMIESLEAGAAVFLNKPIGAKQLLEEVELTLKESRK